MMAAAIICFAIAFLSSTFGDQLPGTVFDDKEYEGAFEVWRHRYHKSYATPEEQDAHFAAFKRNYDIVKTTNLQGHSFTVELNKFADIAPEDFSLMHGTTRDRNSSIWDGLPMLGAHKHNQDEALPDSIDWNAKGMVTAVKNQGHCGACWAFTTTGSIESAWAIGTKGKQLLQLSEQQLVDCDTHENGCGGGNPKIAFTYLQTTALCTEGTYPYKAQQGSCNLGGCTAAVMAGGIAGWKPASGPDVGFDITNLMSAVAQQPVTASIAGDDPLFQLYSGGILQDKGGKVCSEKVDHSILLVGYGKQDGLDYWLVKNSWGTDWGESGYAKVLRGKKNDDVGECGIRSESSYPVVDSSKTNPWLNGPPIGTILAAVLGGLAGLILLICVIRKCIQKRQMQQGSGGGRTLRAGTSTAARPLVTPVSPAIQAAAAPKPSVQAAQAVDDPNVRKGNSRASRLVQ